MHDPYSIASRLSPSPVITLQELDKGGNSRIYKVITQDAAYALKRYPVPNTHDTRNRLHTETQALRFMRSHSIVSVPEVIATDEESMHSLLSWSDGTPLDMVQDTDIAEYADFLICLSDISHKAGAQGMPYASEVCISGPMIIEHIEKRRHKLQPAMVEHADLRDFMGKFATQLATNITDAQSLYAAHGLDFMDTLPRAAQTLIPSDFGCHNALREQQGLHFLDFEYFGWDDPVTSTANFILHPAMQLTQAQITDFSIHMQDYFHTRDPHYALRLQALLPLYAARWAMIILGEFIPSQWEHRVACGKYREEDKPRVQAEQLRKAEHVLNKGK